MKNIIKNLAKKKKTVIPVGIAFLLVVFMFIPPVQAAAISAMSIFRVGDTKTINITMGDIQDIMTYFKQSGALSGELDKAKAASNDTQDGQAAQLIGQNGQLSDQLTGQLKDQLSSVYKSISKTSDFKAFSFKLPGSLKSETPQLYEIDPQAQTFTINTDEINKELTACGIDASIDASLNGETVTVNTPPAIVAQYPDLLIGASQGIYLDASNKTVETLWNNIINMPFIPEDLRSQLANIDVKSRDVYLPVIMGIGRETSIGSTVGYIYSVKDLSQISALLPEGAQGIMNSDKFAGMQDASALIFTKNGILYCVAGNKSDSELTQIAKGIR